MSLAGSCPVFLTDGQVDETPKTTTFPGYSFPRHAPRRYSFLTGIHQFHGVYTIYITRTAKNQDRISCKVYWKTIREDSGVCSRIEVVVPQAVAYKSFRQQFSSSPNAMNGKDYCMIHIPREAIGKFYTKLLNQHRWSLWRGHIQPKIINL